MRVWDIHPKHLCRKHLLAEHRELHGLWNILTIHHGKGGYSRHPETLRWVGKEKALYQRHQSLVKEFKVRGYHHYSPLNIKYIKDSKGGQKFFINTIKEQKEILKKKPCECLLD
ncbi:MAG: pyrimidine dimer DNA glycosylase/endonuclease V [Candidatus Paceibacterota bacterium]